MHYKLFDFENHRDTKSSTLQENAKIMFNRQNSMLNNRSVFDGLQVGNSNDASLLSFQRYDAVSNKDMTLRERIMSQLHDELPGLDPFLKKYIMQFRILLLRRMIRCPNVLALRFQVYDLRFDWFSVTPAADSKLEKRSFSDPVLLFWYFSGAGVKIHWQVFFCCSV